MTRAKEDSVVQAFRLLPSERVLWEGRPEPVPRDARYRIIPALAGTFAVIAALFATLLGVVELAGARPIAFVAAYLGLLAVAVWLAPRFLVDPCRYVVTDRRVLWKRGRLRRSIDRHAVTFARIHWHPSRAGVGHLEVVRAVPFGPLARRQRLIFHDVKDPDLVLATVRGVPPPSNEGDADLPLAERLEPGEQVLWGGGPEGLMLGWRDLLTAIGGGAVLFVGLRYGHRAGAILLDLEEHGLPLVSWTWVLLFTAMALTAATILTVGIGMAWHGVFRARAMGRDTEYILTDRRLLIRRGRIELSLDRRHIVDVAESRSLFGVTHLYLILDAPEARALADSGALSALPPSRDTVPPVLYELKDAHDLRALLFRTPAVTPELTDARASAPPA